MQTQTPTTTPSTPSISARSSLTLDALAAMSLDELDALYRTATVSKTMHAADGALVGRMLAVRGLGGPLAQGLRRFAASRSFVWEGKSFQATSDTKGTGINRVSIPKALGRQNLFPFATAFGPSAIDGKPTLVLDYALDVNPSYIQAIHDEIREVAPGLFLGPAMWKGAGGKKTLVLWFALDSRLA
ncbi:MAG: hypothetical protein JNL83_38230 [Myxococcales bacterium]|nr:hypothetical protein [Myxococcales bacterium]